MPPSSAGRSELQIQYRALVGCSHVQSDGNLLEVRVTHPNGDSTLEVSSCNELYTLHIGKQGRLNTAQTLSGQKRLRRRRGGSRLADVYAASNAVLP